MLAAGLSLNLGWVFADGDQPQYADRLFKKAISILETNSSTEGLPAAAAYNALSRLKLKTGEVTAAKELAEKSLKICEGVLDKAHPHTATALESLGDALLAEGKAERAVELYASVLTIREKKFGKDHHLVAETLARRAKAEDILKQPDRALSSLTLAYDLLVKRFGEKLPPVYRWVADAYAVQLRGHGREEEAKAVVANVRPATRLK
jgi:tetratricopeptide (TPR) repeat protein